MKQELKEFIKSKKFREMFLYLFFGGLTTVINISVYFVCYYYLKISNTAGNVAAWILAVLFAYITNKLWVFGSRAHDKKTVLREMSQFFGCRLGTGLLELAIMYLCVDVLAYNAGTMKIITNVIVIILNYAASKLLIFVKK